MSAVSSSLTILTTCWPGLSWPSTSLPSARSLTLRRELLDDLEVDVGLEQREADLAHRLVDVVLGQRAAGTDVGQGRLELLGEGVEHGRPRVELAVWAAARRASVARRAARCAAGLPPALASRSG